MKWNLGKEHHSLHGFDTKHRLQVRLVTNIYISVHLTHTEYMTEVTTDTACTICGALRSFLVVCLHYNPMPLSFQSAKSADTSRIVKCLLSFWKITQTFGVSQSIPAQQVLKYTRVQLSEMKATVLCTICLSVTGCRSVVQLSGKRPHT